MNPLKFSLTLLPFLSLVACGPAFEVGNLFPDDAGQSSPDGASHDAGTTAHDAAESDSHQNSSQDGGQTLDGPGDLQEAASAPETGPEAASEAASPPECSAPRCVDGMTLQSCDDGTWGTFSTCPYVCLDNACSGVCTPNATSCSSDTQLQTCNSSGQWVNSTCPNACVGSSCSGVCVPGATSVCYDACSEQGSETCGSNGQWGPCSVSCGN